ncbi:cysteine hydrolase [Stutzerimonas nosocomialis]|uniref:Cysteine hydrolase n=1 Tax=Stutzerimonas nosocomialis TaxID=1056496 RepID=A0A5R9QGC1_9GAMM|nr:isochorismatase family cysteine hydrolase [Stutzerimonas nosocomialis]TLX64249.1 cysteine hydrolase [Stutzerimonas nosocomialis]
MGKPLITWPLHRGRTAIVVVDMQKVFCEPDGALYVPATAAIIQPIAALLECARAAAVPVIYLRHVVRGDGSDTGRMRDLYPNVDRILARDDPGIQVIEALSPRPGDVVVDKLFYSGFHNTDLDTVLRARDIDTLVVCGTVTNVCCDTTIRDAVHREYKVIALSDASAAMDYPDLGWGAVSAADVQRVALTTFAYEFGEVTTTENLMGRLAG